MTRKINPLMAAWCRVRCWLLIVAAVSVSASVYWMATDTQPPFLLISAHIVPDNPRPGDEIAVAWNVKVNRVCDGTVERRIVDSHGVMWAYSPVASVRPDQIQAGHPLLRPFRLPEHISSGPAFYSAELCYACNPLQRIWGPFCIRTMSVPFNVSAATPER